MWTVLVTSFVACLLPVPSTGQGVGVSRPARELSTPLAQAELALDRGDVVTAERGYAAVLAVDPAPVQVGFIGASETGASASGTSIGVEFPGGDRGRVGVHYQRRSVASVGDAAQTQWLGFRASARPRSDVQLSLSGGAGWTPSPERAEASRLRPDVAFQVRRSGASEGLILEVKAQRDPIDVTPDLVRAPVSRTRVVTSVDVPVGGPWRLRGQAHAAVLMREDERNRRTGGTAGVGVAVTPAIRLAAQWHQTRNSNPAARGYFAPAIAEVVEIGLELKGEYDRATIALDAGGGLQRFQRADQPMGAWAPTLRVWGLVAWSIGGTSTALVRVR